MFGTSKQTIGHWETGQNMPSAEQVARVADEYGESVEWLLFGRRATSFTAELQARLALVDDDALRRLENGLRSHFDMEPLAKQAPAKRRQAA